MVKEFFRYRSHLTAFATLAAISLLLTQVPLFNYLGYEFSAVIALVWSLIAGLLTISLWKRFDQDHATSLSPFLLHGAMLGLIPLLLPLGIISLNVFFVKNCSFLGGSILFLLIVPPGVLIAQAAALFISVTVQHWKKSAFVLAWLLASAHILFVTFTGPQIFAFNPIMGYFAGLTYDESLEVADRLLFYRLGTVAATMLIVMAAHALFRRKHPGTGSHPVLLQYPHRAAALMLATFVSLMFFFSNDIGLSSTDSSIEKTLGGQVETDHFVISFPDSLLRGERLAQVVKLHEYCYLQITRALRTRPARKIHTFLYATPEQKGRLIGAAGTNIAKPWLWQLHINLADVDATLKHELVHVFAADFGFPLIRVGLNSGLIEGLAVAVERVHYEEPLHRLAAMAVQTGLAPKVENLFSITGFMKAPATVSYVAAGSFCRYLIDRYGIRRFKMLYRTSDFVLLYGKSLPDLIKEWERFLSDFRFNGGDRAKAEYLFNRRSIFGKECARVIANMNKETREFLSKRQYEQALASAEHSLSQSVSVEASIQKSTALLRLGRYAEAIAFAESKLADTTTGSSFLTLRVLLADALWGVDSVESAMKLHADLLRSHLSMAWDEALSLRLEIMLNPSLSEALRPYYVSLNDDSGKVALLEHVTKKFATEAVPRFLLARERIGQERLEEAVRLLDSIPAMRSPILELARQRRLGQLSMALGRYELAKIYFWQALNHVYRDAQAHEFEEKVRFAEWLLTGQERVD